MYYAAHGVTGEQSEHPQNYEYYSNGPHMVFLSVASQFGVVIPPVLPRTPSGAFKSLFDRDIIFDIFDAIDGPGEFSSPVLLLFGVHKTA